jgi:hypothetical protein
MSTDADTHDPDGGVWGLPDRVPVRFREALFILVLGAYVALIVATATGYSQNARRFPLVIGVPLLGLILLKVVILVGGDRLSLPATGLVSDMIDLDTGGEDTIASWMRRRREIEMVAWVGLFVALVWALGFQVGGVLFTAAFVFRYERDVVRALLAGAVTYAIVYLLFIQLLNRRLVDPALLPDAIVQVLP